MTTGDSGGGGVFPNDFNWSGIGVEAAVSLKRVEKEKSGDDAKEKGG